MNMRVVAALGRLVLLCALAGATSACATVVGGTTQEVFIETVPAGAECKVDRLGANVAVVKPTPGRVNVSRSKEAMVVACTLDKHEQSNEVLSSKFTGATIGNILLGGVVGIVVDAASGANNKYPEKVTIVMTPIAFSNEAARDAHFASVKAKITTAAADELKRIRDTCNSNNRELCREQEKPVVEALDRAI
jgi:hypothetical protein